MQDKGTRIRAREESSDEDDLLKFVAVAIRREEARVRQQKYRAKKRMKAGQRQNGRKCERKRECTRERFLKPVSSEIQDRCVRNLREALGAEGLDEVTCSICDRLVLARDIVRKEGDDWNFMGRLRRILGVRSDSIPGRLADQYRAPPHIQELDDVLVSPRGIHYYVDECGCPTAWVGICSDCMNALSENRIPKFAIANGFCIGRLPENLRGLTIPERFLTQFSTFAAITRVMRGGRHRCIRSHCLAFDCTPGAPISLLPRSLDNVSSYRVVMVGDFTEDQAAKVKKMHRIRNQKVRDVFEFYKANNALYKSVVPSVDDLAAEYPDEVIDEHFFERVEDTSEILGDSISTELESVRGHSDSWQVNEEDERVVLERRVGLMDDTSSSPVVSEMVAEIGDAVNSERSFMLRGSNQFSHDVNGDLFARLFPHLFPFGHGHPGEQRRSAVSLKEAIKHYIALSGRQFAEDELFTLVAFDRLALQNMYIQNSVRCKRFPQLLNGFESIGVEQLGNALIANERRRQGCLPRAQRADDTAARFLKSVDIAARSVWGSNSERSQCRQRAFAFQARFGQPALFVTLTPNTDNSFAMAHYTGISSVKSLFDALEARIPTKAELREASLHNDCASARLFMRQVDAFIRHVLGIDPTTKKPIHEQGLFGKVKAYFGMVETQGRGTLHIHFLIWLQDALPNSAAVDEMMASKDAKLFGKSVEDYTNSIVSNTLPLKLSDFRCSGCGGGFSNMVPLHVPEVARKDPQGGLYNADKKRNVTEPPMIKCRICNVKCSSQHLMRSILLQRRPSYWPMWKEGFSSREVLVQASREKLCRDTLRNAKRVVEQREDMEFSLSSGGDMINGSRLDVGVTQWLEHLNAPQMKLFKSDNDPFQNDNLTRLIEVLPPSTYDERMPQEALDYMVSTLVLLLNQHWWGHTNTCFKQSRMTDDPSCCRYGFPKERVARTTFTGSGVQLGREVGHEFINGFNSVIMATFKCNHDVQVLLGGGEATHRIHYCCKYVTKQQRRLDSVVAIALGAFKRRRERELLDTMTSPADSDSNRAIARKRIASVVYSTTNRQEIAGPLAALYLERGSCCYASATCMTLPLGAIIRQLNGSEEYACRLVGECNEFGALNFQAVSSVDDYIFRNEALANMNLYEFSIEFFRRKDSHAADAKYSFLSGHPLHQSHSLGRRFQKAVPVIQGYRIPHVGSDSSVEFRCKRAILSLVLFKPFRSLVDLIGDVPVSDEAWLLAYDEWENTRSDFVKEIMNNMSDYYTGLSNSSGDNTSAESLPSQPIVQPNEARETNNRNSDEDDLFDVDRTRALDDYDDVNDNADEIQCIWDNSEDCNSIPESSSLHPSICPSTASPDSRITSILDVFTKYGLVDSVAAKTASESRHLDLDPVSAHALGKWIRDAGTDNSLIVKQSEQPDVRQTEMIELFEEMLDEPNTSWHPEPMAQSGPPPPVKAFASISAVSRSFTLNEKQHLALKVIGIALMNRWKKADTMSYINGNIEEALRADQLRIFLGGEGGTGKSRVIDAVESLCVSWERPCCLVKTALTGKAATLIKGRTLESFLLQLNGEKAIETAMDLDVLIIDEISMMKKLQLVELDRRLRIVKRLPNVPFGGIHIVLVGDFLQLPPVGADPIYRDPSLKRKRVATDFVAFDLWRSFESVVVLDESVRFRDDPAWGRGCHEARRGVWRDEFVNLINSRVMQQNSNSLRSWFSTGDRTTFVTPDNSTRLSINNLYISTTAKMLPEGSYPVRIVADFRGKLKELRRAEIEMIMGFPDSKLGRMAPYLDLIVGMPVQITQNVRPQKMVANGTIGTLESIMYAAGTTFRIIHDSVADIFVKIPSKPPIAVIIRLHRGDSAQPMMGSTDSDLFPLLLQSAYKQSQIRLTPGRGSEPRVLSVCVRQFPLVCAVASTVYKVQGDTLNRMVVTEWKSKSEVANKPQQPYLLVSRVTSRHAFFTLTRLTPELIRWAHPPADALNEEERLLRLSARTCRSHGLVSIAGEINI